jgi:GWxTD domain-containing protein
MKQESTFKTLGKLQSLSCILVCLFLFSCSVKRQQKPNVNFLYDAGEPYYLISLSLFHADEENTDVHFRIPAHWFFSPKETVQNSLLKGFTLTYEFFNDNNSKTPDVRDHVLFDSIEQHDFFWHHFSVSLPLGSYKQGKLDVFIQKEGKKEINFSLPFNRNDFGNRQFYYLEQRETGRIPLSVLTTSDTFQLAKSPLIISDSLYVFYFRHFNDIAPPPFTLESAKIFPWKQDSVFTIPFQENKTGMLNFQRAGVYHFMADTTLRHGFTVFVSKADFPFISNHAQMSGPLRYICSNKEFQQILETPDLRTAVEDFWLKISSNPEAATRQIRDYYNRVQYANVFFTSYKEGWMTDRGMIYIVMGRPGVVYKSPYQEIWIYGQEKNLHSTTFEFRKVLNPLSDNDYLLMRYPVLKDRWYRAVDMWRK